MESNALVWVAAEGFGNLSLLFCFQNTGWKLNNADPGLLIFLLCLHTGDLVLCLEDYDTATTSLYTKLNELNKANYRRSMSFKNGVW